MRSRILSSAAGALFLALGLAACTNDPSSPTVADDAVPDFALQDVNPNSAGNGTPVAVRDYLGSVSAWYFAHAT